MCVNYLTLIVSCFVISVSGSSNLTIVDDFENVTAGNDLWLGLVRDCKKPTLSCVKNSIYDYLKGTLDYPNDVQFTSFMKFSKNNVEYHRVDRSFDESSIDTVDDASKDETPLEEMTRSLSDNTRKFFMTHDLEVSLPETFFLGSTLKLSPRSLDASGTLVNVELIPRTLEESVGQGRIFFKKIKKFINERLLYALLAILLVIKLLAVKILFVLPTIVGVATAKKLILKVLLFLFPALHHLFKLCAYVPYGAKHHIHKHHIAHIHEVHPHHHHPPHGAHYGGPIEVVSPHAEGPPHHYSDFAHKEYYDPYGEQDGYPGGSYHDDELISHRNDPNRDENEIDPWGLGQTTRRPKPDNSRPPTPTEIENMVLKAEKEALIKSRLQKEKQRIHEENLRLQDQLNNALKVQEKLKQQAAIFNAKLSQNLMHVTHHHKSVKPQLSSSFSPPPPHPPPKYLKSHFAEPPDDEVYPEVAVTAHVGYMKQQKPTFTEVEIRPVYKPSFVHENGRVQNYQPQKHFVASDKSYQESEPLEISQSSEGAKLFENTKKFATYRPVEVAKPFQNEKTFETPKPQEFSKQFQVSGTIETSEKLEAPKPSDFQNPVHIQKPSLEQDIYKAATITYDRFYSPILEKIDKILNELNFNDEPCKERLICSMYKSPFNYSPHSNLLSAELSRDSKDLQKPKSTNSAVIRFYRYVQAARDGQDKRDCMRLYTGCAINTEII